MLALIQLLNAIMYVRNVLEVDVWPIKKGAKEVKGGTHSINIAHNNKAYQFTCF